MKATERLKALADGETIVFFVPRHHLAYWRNETMPVVLVMHSVMEECACWLYVQAYLLAANVSIETDQNEITMRLPKRSVMDESAIETLQKIKSKVLRRINEREMSMNHTTNKTVIYGRLNGALLSPGFRRQDTETYIAYFSDGYDSIFALPIVDPSQSVRPAHF